jgi:hypothetical protein
MVRSKSNVKYYAKQIKNIIMRKDVVYLGMIWCNDIMSLNTSDEGYNNGKKCGQKGAICGPNTKKVGSHLIILVLYVDDLILIGSDSKLLNHVKTSLEKKFEMTDLGYLHYFLGL